MGSAAPMNLNALEGYLRVAKDGPVMKRLLKNKLEAQKAPLPKDYQSECIDLDFIQQTSL